MRDERNFEQECLPHQEEMAHNSINSSPIPLDIRVLYGDDDPDICRLFKIFLEKAGHFKVETVESGEEVLQALSDCIYDAIVSDYHMPGMNGIVLLKKIRDLDPSIPFILFTGKGREEVVMDAINNGVTFYLQKGGNPQTVFAELAHKINQAVGKQRAESALQQSEEKYRTLVDHLQDGVFITQEELLSFINPAFASLIGYSVRELTGSKFIEVIAPEDRKMMTDRHRRRLNGDSVPEQYEFRMLHHDGKTSILVNLDVGITLFQGKPAVIGTVRDITRRRKAEEAAHESEQRLADVIDFLPDATFVIDGDGMVIAWNRAMEQLTGLATKDIVGCGDQAYAIPFYGLKRPMLVDVALRGDTQAERLYLSPERVGETIIAEIYIPNLAGRTKYLWGAATPLRNSKGIIVGAIESIKDITDRKQAESELVRASEELERRVTERTAELTQVNAVLLTEIEERKLAETALRESEERYRRLVELSPD